MSALAAAAEGGHVSAVALLLGWRGVNVNSRNDRGQTPLMDAAVQGHVEVIQTLMMCDGVDLNARCNLGMTALDMAVDEGNDYNGYNEAVALVLRRDAMEVNEKVDNVGLTPPMHAAA